MEPDIETTLRDALEQAHQELLAASRRYSFWAGRFEQHQKTKAIKLKEVKDALQETKEANG